MKIKPGDKVWFKYNKHVWHRATVISKARFLFDRVYTLSLHAPSDYYKDGIATDVGHRYLRKIEES